MINKLKKNCMLKKQTKCLLSLHMHVKLSFAHCLQVAKMVSSGTSAQNNGPRAQNNDRWVSSVSL